MTVGLFVYRVSRSLGSQQSNRCSQNIRLVRCFLPLIGGEPLPSSIKLTLCGALSQDRQKDEKLEDLHRPHFPFLVASSGEDRVNDG